MINKIPYGRQYIDQNDIDAVVSTLQSDFLTQGPKVRDFEDLNLLNMLALSLP